MSKNPEKHRADFKFGKETTGGENGLFVCCESVLTAFGQLTPLPASGSAMALALDCARSARAQGRVNLPSVIEGGQSRNLPARHAGALSAAWEGLSACERLIGVGEH